MKKALALENSSEVLKTMIETHHARDKEAYERFRFVLKQLEAVKTQKRKISDDFDAELAAFFRARGELPPDFNPKKHHFHVEAGAVILCDEAGEGLDGAMALVRILTE